MRMRRRNCEDMDEEGTVGKGTVGRQMQSGNWGNGCGEGTEEMDKRKKLWGNGCRKGTTVGRGLWGKGCREGDCGERNVDM